MNAGEIWISKGTSSSPHINVVLPKRIKLIKYIESRDAYEYLIDNMDVWSKPPDIPDLSVMRRSFILLFYRREL